MKSSRIVNETERRERHEKARRERNIRKIEGVGGISRPLAEKLAADDEARLFWNRMIRAANGRELRRALGAASPSTIDAVNRAIASSKK